MLLFRLGFPIAAVALLGGALSSPDFRDADGFLTTPFTLAFSLSIALCVFSGVTVPRWRPFSFWLALAVTGQAAALQLIDAGKLIHYQHYRGWRHLFTDTHPVIQVALLVQLVCVLIGIAPRMRGISSFLRNRVGVSKSLLLAAVFVGTAATVSRDVTFFAGELALATLLQALNLCNVILLAASLPEGVLERLRSVFGPDVTETSRPRFLNHFSLCAATWVFAVAATLNWFSYECFPHVADEVVYVHPARYFAAGMLTMPSPPVSEAFEMDLMTNDGQRWYSPVPPGWPVLLAAGVAVGVPWLVNPFLAAIGVLLLSYLVERLYGPGTARLTALLTATSPWYIFLAMSYMNHIATLTMALLGAVTLVIATDRRTIVWALGSGAAVGYVGLIRPLDGVIVAAALGLAVLGRCHGSFRWKLLGQFAVGFAVLIVIQLTYNQRLTGDVLRFPLNAYFDTKYGDGVNDLGFGPDRGIGWEIDPYPGHGPRDVLVNTQLNFSTMNTELHGWATGSLLVIALLFLAGRPRTIDWYLLGIVGAVVGVYSLYWFSGGPDFGPRYWFLAFFPLVTLSARGIHAVADRVGSPRVIAAALCLTALCVLNFLPWRSVDKYSRFRGMGPYLCQPDARNRFGRGLVLIRGEQFPDYMAAAACNPIHLNADQPVFAWDRGPAVREKLAATFPDRPVWVVDGPSRTGAGYQIIEAPQ